MDAESLNTAIIEPLTDTVKLEIGTVQEKKV